jgi:hypothetical protein
VPFKGNRFFYLIGAVALLVIIIAAASAASAPKPVIVKDPDPTATPVPDDGKVHITIYSNIGIQQIKITNLNTQRSIIKTLIDLPYTFTCDRGSFIRFAVTTQPGFVWNAWEFNTATFPDNANPMTMIAQYDFTMMPKTIILEVLGGNTNATG